MNRSSEPFSVILTGLSLVILIIPWVLGLPMLLKKVAEMPTGPIDILNRYMTSFWSVLEIEFHLRIPDWHLAYLID